MDVNSDISNSEGPLPETNSSPLKILHPKRNFIFQPSIHQFSGASCWVSGNCKSSPLSSIKSCNLKIDGWKATFLKGAWIFFSAAKMWVSGRAHPYPSLMTFMPRLCLSWERDSCCFSSFLLSIWRVNHHTKVSWLLKKRLRLYHNILLIHLLHMQVTVSYKF